eukprot:COSAG04_NODE_9834_length_828_cov_1.480110_1_plen_175_part_10
MAARRRRQRDGEAQKLAGGVQVSLRPPAILARRALPTIPCAQAGVDQLASSGWVSPEGQERSSWNLRDEAVQRAKALRSPMPRRPGSATDARLAVRRKGGNEGALLAVRAMGWGRYDKSMAQERPDLAAMVTKARAQLAEEIQSEIDRSQRLGGWEQAKEEDEETELAVSEPEPE